MSTNYENLIQNKLVKILLIIVVSIFVIVVLVGLFSEKHINILGIEFNGTTKQSPEKEIQYIRDTIRVYENSEPKIQEEEVKKVVAEKNPQSKKEKNSTQEKKESIKARDNSHIISGNNNQVGVNGDVNYGVKQRHINPTLLNEIQSKILSKESEINIWFVRENKESYNYGNEIFKLLQSLGYKNLKGTGWFLPGCYDEVKLEMKKDSTLMIKICPIGNVD